MTSNTAQFVWKVFAVLCVAVEIKLTIATQYHSNVTGQVKRFNKTLTARLRHCINDHQFKMDTYVQPLTYGYVKQNHRTIITSPSSLVLGLEPFGVQVSKKTRTLEVYSKMQPVHAKTRVREILRLLSQQAERASQSAGLLYEKYFNKKVRHPSTLKAGDWVYVHKYPNLREGRTKEDTQYSLKNWFPKWPDPLERIE